jgi:Methyltransferase domain
MRNTGAVGALKQAIYTKPILRPVLSAWFGTLYSVKHFWPKLLAPYWSILKTGEASNFTYELKPENLRYLVETLSVVTGHAPQIIEGYISEVLFDNELMDFINAAMKNQNKHGAMQSVAMPFGRRLGWYAMVRTIKPRVVVETGVERGHGSVLLCAALLKNAQEGQPGRYFGTDINPNAGWLLGGKYAEVGKILYGDSIASLERFAEKIDIFINDSDHSAEYEAAEYRVIASKLSPGAIVLGDNSHVTDKLAIFARETGRHFIFFKEEPQDHWYPGAGIGFSY